MDLTNEPAYIDGNLYVKDPDIITCWDKDSTEVIRIAPDGKVFWKQREVETDDDFRSAMLDLAQVLKGNVIYPVKELTDEVYFCSRCGKRLGDGIHTCTPPADILRKAQEK